MRTRWYEKVLENVRQRIYNMGFRPGQMSIFYSPSLTLSLGAQQAMAQFRVDLDRAQAEIAKKVEEEMLFNKRGRHRAGDEKQSAVEPLWAENSPGIFTAARDVSEEDLTAKMMQQRYTAAILDEDAMRMLHIERIKFCPVCGGTLLPNAPAMSKVCPFGHGTAWLTDEIASALPTIAFEIYY